MQSSQVAEWNRKVYGSAEAARYYVEAVEGIGLLEEERAILDRFGDLWRGKSLLDIGVGGGRTTPHFLDLCGHYVGIDFVEQMVRLCRERFPGVDFRCRDARHLGEFGGETFDVAWFSFNGIDNVPIEDRRRVLAEVQRVLRPDGAFIFSSHNLAAEPPPAPSLWPPFVFDRNPLRLARRNLSLLRYHVADLLNYRCHRQHEVRGPGYAVRVDAAHHYRLLTCYVAPRWQVEQLGAEGFRDIMLFGTNGSFLDRHAATLDPWVHYVAFKGETSTDSRPVAPSTGLSP
jgi:SAM-dependent methyltransferase